MAASTPFVCAKAATRRAMPSSMARSAPPENVSLPDVITQPLTDASCDTVSMTVSSSAITSSVMTFMERLGMFHVRSARPSASTS